VSSTPRITAISGRSTSTARPSASRAIAPAVSRADRQAGRGHLDGVRRAHYDPGIAVRRAMTELNQFITAVIDVRADRVPGYAYHDEFQLAWWALGDGRRARVPAARSGAAASHGGGLHRPVRRWTCWRDVLTAQRLVEERGMELLVLDQTPAGHRAAGRQGHRSRHAALLDQVRPRAAVRRAGCAWAGSASQLRKRCLTPCRCSS